MNLNNRTRQDFVSEEDWNAYCYNLYSAQAHSNPEVFGLAGAANYEHQRGLRQLGHYFDVNAMPTSVMPSAHQQQQQTTRPKPTAAQMRYFKAKKEEKKKLKNKWLYD